MEKLEWCCDGEKIDDTFSRFVTYRIPTCVEQTDKQTDRRTS